MVPCSCNYMFTDWVALRGGGDVTEGRERARLAIFPRFFHHPDSPSLEKRPGAIATARASARTPTPAATSEGGERNVAGAMPARALDAAIPAPPPDQDRPSAMRRHTGPRAHSRSKTPRWPTLPRSRGAATSIAEAAATRSVRVSVEEDFAPPCFRSSDPALPNPSRSHGRKEARRPALHGTECRKEATVMTSCSCCVTGATPGSLTARGLQWAAPNRN